MYSPHEDEVYTSHEGEVASFIMRVDDLVQQRHEDERYTSHEGEVAADDHPPALHRLVRFL